MAQSARSAAKDISARHRTSWRSRGSVFFCSASQAGPTGSGAGIMSETVIAMVVKGLLARDSLGRLALTDDGRAALRALLPEL